MRDMYGVSRHGAGFLFVQAVRCAWNSVVALLRNHGCEY
jgi:hypothetical protein